MTVLEHENLLLISYKFLYLHIYFHTCSTELLNSRQHTEWKIHTLSDTVPVENIKSQEALDLLVNIKIRITLSKGFYVAYH